MFSNVLDSRSIGFGDAFGQRFMRPGTYRYNIVLGGAGCMVDDRPYVVEVEKGGGAAAMEQHSLVVRCDGRSFSPDREAITIREGDLVVWACPDPAAARFEVRGDKEFFGSGRLTNECGYSHTFGLPGEYRWVDALHGSVRGVVRVKDVRAETCEELERWRKRLAKGTLVMIADGKAEPAVVDIVTGQTVFFAVVKGEGISITDSSLVGGAAVFDKLPPIKPSAKPKAKKVAPRRG